MSEKVKGTVAIDLDGTLAEYHGWNKNGPTQIGPPLPGALEFLEKVGQDYNIVLYTTRQWKVVGSSDTRTWVLDVDTWLQKYCSRLPHYIYARISVAGSNKPKALVYIDDRGFRFTGSNWDDAYDAITQPAHWESPSIVLGTEEENATQR